MDTTLKSLTAKRDPSCVKDFIQNVVIDSADKGEKLVDAITLDSAADLLTHVNKLVNSKYESHLMTALLATKQLFY